MSAPKGALPDGAEVHAVLVNSSSVEAAVASAVASEGKELTGLKAYDITITDADSNKIQLDEKVKVSIEGAGVQGESVSV